MLRNSKIPKIIHQIWYQGENNIPEKYKKWQNSWKKYHPDWEYKLWDEHSMRDLIKNEYPWFLKHYDNYPHMIQRIDAIRGFILYKYGGLYIDLDFEAFKPIDTTLNNNESIYIIYSPWPREKIQNSLIASQPGHKFFKHHNKKLLEYSKNNYKKYGGARIEEILDSTGPRFLTKIYENFENKNDIKILGDDYFNGPNAKHYSTQSWLLTKNYIIEIALSCVCAILAIIIIILISIRFKNSLWIGLAVLALIITLILLGILLSGYNSKLDEKKENFILYFKN